jgi:shikimate dehydrogenase
MDAKSASRQLAILLGDPVAHSKSPVIMTAAAKAAAIDMVYVACRVRDCDLAQAVDAIHALGILGANVTIPHKQRVIEFLDDLTAAARAVGAVNTIFRDAEDRLIGDNTDIAGFTAPIRERGLASALVLGTGGAARAAAWACLHELGMERVLVSGRTPEKAEVLVHALSQGSAGQEGRMETGLTMIPWQERHDTAARVYNPAETRLLREARERGARTQGGMDMLIGQAAAAFQRWTGRPMDTLSVRGALSPREYP